MKREQVYEIAVSNFQREHDRWIQNALVLFGVLISILLTDKRSDILPQWAAMILMTSLSAMALLIALTIRGSTDAWRETVRVIEQSRAENELCPFEIFEFYLDWYTESNGHRRDLWDILHVYRKDVRYSVTRLYALAALIATLFFGGRFLWIYFPLLLRYVALCTTAAKA